LISQRHSDMKKTRLAISQPGISFFEFGQRHSNVEDISGHHPEWALLILIL